MSVATKQGAWISAVRVTRIDCSKCGEDREVRWYRALYEDETASLVGDLPLLMAEADREAAALRAALVVAREQLARIAKLCDETETDVCDIERATREWFHGEPPAPYTMAGHDPDPTACAHCAEASGIATAAVRAALASPAVSDRTTPEETK